LKGRGAEDRNFLRATRIADAVGPRDMIGEVREVREGEIPQRQIQRGIELEKAAEPDADEGDHDREPQGDARHVGEGFPEPPVSAGG